MKTPTSVLVCLVFAAAILSGCSSSKGSAPSAAVGSATDLAGSLTKSFADATSILGSISGVESAEKAVSGLEGVEAEVDEVAAAAANMPAETTASLSEIVASQVPPLKEAMDTAYAIPGVKDVIQPSMDSLLAKYAGF